MVDNHIPIASDAGQSATVILDRHVAELLVSALDLIAASLRIEQDVEQRATVAAIRVLRDATTAGLQ